MNASWGKRALITGGASGIGLSTAWLLALSRGEPRRGSLEGVLVRHLKRHGDGRKVLEARRSAPPKELTSQ